MLLLFFVVVFYGGEFELCVHVKWYRFVCCDYDLHLHSTGLGQRRSHKLNWYAEEEETSRCHASETHVEPEEEINRSRVWIVIIIVSDGSLGTCIVSCLYFSFELGRHQKTMFCFMLARTEGFGR